LFLQHAHCRKLQKFKCCVVEGLMLAEVAVVVSFTWLGISRLCVELLLVTRTCLNFVDLLLLLLVRIGLLHDGN